MNGKKVGCVHLVLGSTGYREMATPKINGNLVLAVKRREKTFIGLSMLT